MKHDTLTKNIVAVEGRVLHKALKPILSVVEKRVTYPVLSMVRLSVSGASLKLTGTDLDAEISHRLDVNEASGEWSICVDPKTLSKIARLAGPTLVRIWLTAKFTDGLKPDVTPEIVVSVDGDTEYRLACLNADQFPDLFGNRGALIERFTNGRLVAMLKKLSRFISNEETRYYLNGVCWQMREDGRRLVATNGHQLGVCRHAEGGMDTRDDMIIPRKTVAMVNAHLAGLDVEIFSVTRDGKNIPALDLVAGPLTIRTKLIEGTYPDVDRVMPKDNQHRITANRQELLQAIECAAIMRQRYSTALRFYEEDGTMSISSNSPDLGTAKIRTRVAWPGGCSEFGLNATYIRDMVFDCEGEVTISAKDASGPLLVTDEDEEIIRVIMPMRV